VGISAAKSLQIDSSIESVNFAFHIQSSILRRDFEQGGDSFGRAWTFRRDFREAFRSWMNELGQLRTKVLTIFDACQEA
jgi:hypothetical protein